MTSRSNLPQRYFDALEHPYPGLKSPSIRFAMRKWGGKNPYPTQAQLEHFGHLMMEHDPVADAWARTNVGSDKDWFALFHKALDQDLDKIKDVPNALRTLLIETETEPLWLDRNLLKVGAHFSQRLGNMWGRILGNLALLGGYYSGAITKPLIFTGALEARTDRRLQETAQFTLAVTRDGNLDYRAEGWKSALKVRMMHGVIRKRIADHPDWQSELWGEPINQADMIGTNMAFSFVPIMTGRILGYRIAEEEVLGHLHLWKYIGHLMGIDQRHLPTTETEAWRILYTNLKLTPPPDEDSRALASAYREEAERGGARSKHPVLGRFEGKLTDGFARFLMPGPMAKALGVPNTIWAAWPISFALTNFALESIRMRTPYGTQIASFIGDRMQRRAVEKWAEEQASFVPTENVGRSARTAKAA